MHVVAVGGGYGRMAGKSRSVPFRNSILLGSQMVIQVDDDDIPAENRSHASPSLDVSVWISCRKKSRLMPTGEKTEKSK